MTQVASDIPAHDSTTPPRFLPVTEVCARTGVTYRQLDYWCRTGYMPDHEGYGSGSVRQWTEEDVAYLTVFMKLVNAGLELKVADRIMKSGLIDNGMVRLSDEVVLVFEPVVS